MNKKTWAHLHNAEAISRIIGAARGWKLGLGDCQRSPEMEAAWDDLVLRNETTDPYRDWELVRNSLDCACNGRAWDVASDAILVLIVHPDCAYILDLHPDVVRLMAASGNQPAILLERTIRIMHGEAK